MPPDPASERSLIAKIAVETSWARTIDRAARTAPAREEFLARFERQVDPEGLLPPTERARRAEHARKAHFARLALASVQARRARKASPAAAADAARSEPSTVDGR